MMPFEKDPGVRESEQYCSLCFKNGELMYKGNNRKEFQEIVRRQMRESGNGWFFTTFAVFMIRFAPRWKAR